MRMIDDELFEALKLELAKDPKVNLFLRLITAPKNENEKPAESDGNKTEKEVK